MPNFPVYLLLHSWHSCGTFKMTKINNNKLTLSSQGSLLSPIKSGQHNTLHSTSSRIQIKWSPPTAQNRHLHLCRSTGVFTLSCKLCDYHRKSASHPSVCWTVIAASLWFITLMLLASASPFTSDAFIFSLLIFLGAGDTHSSVSSVVFSSFSFFFFFWTKTKVHACWCYTVNLLTYAGLAQRNQTTATQGDTQLAEHWSTSESNSSKSDQDIKTAIFHRK